MQNNLYKTFGVEHISVCHFTFCKYLHGLFAGNCQAVLVRDNRPYLLTKAHNYSNSKERNRITSSGMSDDYDDYDDDD